MDKVEVYRGAGALAHLAEEWEWLARQLPQRRFCHDLGWWQAYLDALEPDPDSLYFFLFRDSEGPLAILPVKHFVRRWFGLRQREIGFPDEPHMPFRDMLYRPGAAVPAIIARWRDSLSTEHGLEWDVIRFFWVLRESPLTQVDPATFEVRHLVRCAYFVCDAPYENLSRNYSKNFQANLKKARKRWSKEPGQHYFSVTERKDVERYFAEFLRLEASGWKGAKGTASAIALHPSIEKFYRNLIDQFSPDGRLRIHYLKLHEEVIAAQFCLLVGDTLYILKIAYDEQWSKFSPGTILMEDVIRDCIESGRCRYVNLVGEMDWHHDWQPAYDEICGISSFNSTPMGRISRLVNTAKRHLRPHYKKFVKWRRERARK